MLETPPYPALLILSDNASGDADNQQGSRPFGLTPQRLHAELLATDLATSRAYLLGAMHDATRSLIHRTVRFGQSDTAWLEVVRLLLEKLGQKSWMYREGKSRNVWVLETSSRWLEAAELPEGNDEVIAYTRGYFDTEGGIPKSPDSRFYIQFVQKNLEDISRLRAMLETLDIRCGGLHNPSVRVDPALWRFYIRSESQARFAELVSSWHPRKRRDLDRWLSGRRARMKI